MTTYTIIVKCEITDEEMDNIISLAQESHIDVRSVSEYLKFHYMSNPGVISCNIEIIKHTEKENQ